MVIDFLDRGELESQLLKTSMEDFGFMEMWTITRYWE